MESKDSDWIERAVAVAARIGCNPIRTRWRLTTLQKKLRTNVELTGTRLRHSRYEHQVCSSCGAVQDRNERTCSSCGAKLDHRWLHVANRLSSKFGGGYSNTLLLEFLILLCFWRSCMGPEGFDLALASDPLALLISGGSISYESIDGEWWRFLTCVFLHAGPFHLLFNVVALKQIGPEVEELFGRGRMLFFFAITGIIASLGSSLSGNPGVGIGASGAIMGMIGVAAGWGQRVGSSYGLHIRNQMLRWALYTIIYGYALRADNVAHAVGLLTGMVIGYFSPARSDRQRTPLIDWLLTLCGMILVIGAVTIVLLRPVSLSPIWSEDILSDYEEVE